MTLDAPCPFKGVRYIHFISNIKRYRKKPNGKGARQIFLQSAILPGFTCVVPRAQVNGV
jgi:hypothetical protein